MLYSLRRDADLYRLTQRMFTKPPYGHGYLVMLDGVEQTEVFESDDEAGYILRHKLNEQGHAYTWWKDTHEPMMDSWRTNYNKDREYEVAWERIEGKVMYIIPHAMAI